MGKSRSMFTRGRVLAGRVALNFVHRRTGSVLVSVEKVKKLKKYGRTRPSRGGGSSFIRHNDE